MYQHRLTYGKNLIIGRHGHDVISKMIQIFGLVEMSKVNNYYHNISHCFLAGNTKGPKMSPSFSLLFTAYKPVSQIRHFARALLVCRSYGLTFTI